MRLPARKVGETVDQSEFTRMDQLSLLMPQSTAPTYLSLKVLHVFNKVSFNCEHAIRCQRWTFLTLHQANFYTVRKSCVLEGRPESLSRAFIPTPLKAMKGKIESEERWESRGKKVNGNKKKGGDRREWENERE